MGRADGDRVTLSGICWGLNGRICRVFKFKWQAAVPGCRNAMKKIVRLVRAAVRGTDTVFRWPGRPDHQYQGNEETAKAGSVAGGREAAVDVTGSRSGQPRQTTGCSAKGWKNARAIAGSALSRILPANTVRIRSVRPSISLSRNPCCMSLTIRSRQSGRSRRFWWNEALDHSLRYNRSQVGHTLIGPVT
jgi:hypothetical protein